MSVSRIFVTPSEVIEYMYCPRFIYFMNVLNITQHEHRRTLVNKGRDIHQLKMVRNKDYLRRKVGAISKELDVYLTSEKLKLVGRMDEVLFLDDGNAAPLDYKFAFWDDRIYKTLKMQQTLYALLIEENYNLKVEKAFLVYIRSKNKLVELQITAAMKKKAMDIVNEIFDIININYFPKAAKSKAKCSDCTYRNLCKF